MASVGGRGGQDTGNRVLVEAWESGLLQMDSVPQEFLDGQKERGEALNTQIKALQNTYIKAKQEPEQWMNYCEDLKHKLESAEKSFQDLAAAQEQKMFQDQETARALQEKLQHVCGSVQRMEKKLGGLMQEIEDSKDGPLSMGDTLHDSELSATSNCGWGNEDVEHLDLDDVLSPERAVAARLKEELDEKQKEATILEEDLRTLEGMHKNLEAREKAAEYEATRLQNRRLALKNVEAKFKKQKLRDCEELHLESLEDLNKKIEELQNSCDLEMTNETVGMPENS